MNQFKEFIQSRHRQVIVLIVLMPLLLVGLYLALNPTVFGPKASGGSLKLDPSNVSTKSNQDFVVSLILDPGGQEVLASDIEIKFDPTYLQISSDSIVVAGFSSTPVKRVDASKGIINISLAVSKANPAPLKSTATIATLPFKAKVAGSTSILLGKSQAITAAGQNILENSFSQVSVTVDPQEGTVSQGVPQAVYTFSPNPPQPGQVFTVSVRSLSGEVEKPALFVNGVEVKVNAGANNTYTWVSGTGGSPLQAGKHIFQLAGGCTDIAATKPNCIDANQGFNPYQLNLVDSTVTPTPQASITPSGNATLDEVLANWGKSGSGDVNGDGIVDSKDFVIVFIK